MSISDALLLMMDYSCRESSKVPSLLGFTHTVILYQSKEVHKGVKRRSYHENRNTNCAEDAGLRRRLPFNPTAIP